MDLRQFRYFVEVATNLSFTRAAKRLHISQPTLSQQIRALEHSLGAKLFVRNTAGLAMTQAGKIFLERTTTTLREAQAASDDARAASEGFVGRLNVVCGPMAEYCIMQDVLAIAREKAPQLRIRVRFLPESEQVLEVLGATADVGIMGCFSPSAHPHLRYETLYQESGIVMMPSSHRHAARKSVQLAEFASDWWILPSRDQSPVVHDLFVSECQKAGFQPKINTSADWYSRFPLVSSGAGVCVGASSLLSFRRPGIKFAMIAPVTTVDMGMITRISDNSPQLDNFQQIVHKAVETRASADEEHRLDRRGGGSR
jgi:DNA-binding transcriptional LysR family regulator